MKILLFGGNWQHTFSGSFFDCHYYILLNFFLIQLYRINNNEMKEAENEIQTKIQTEQIHSYSFHYSIRYPEQVQNRHNIRSSTSTQNKTEIKHFF